MVSPGAPLLTQKKNQGYLLPVLQMQSGSHKKTVVTPCHAM